MNASSKRVFYYHADASPIGGYLTHPFETVLHSRASVSLSQAGGHVASRRTAFKHDEIIRTGAHYGQATGAVEKANGNWTTLVTSVVENLNILEVVTADRIVSRLSLVNSTQDGKYYPNISLVGCQFENLRINGHAVTPTVDLNLFSPPEANQNDSYEEDGLMLAAEAAPPQLEFPDKPWPEVDSFVNKAVDQSERIMSDRKAPKWLKSRFDWISNPAARAKRGYVLCSVVNAVPGASPGTSFGHVIHVEGFGNVFLGELIVSPVSFHLTMVRAEMGCASTGNVSMASVRGGTFPMP